MSNSAKAAVGRVKYNLGNFNSYVKTRITKIIKRYMLINRIFCFVRNVTVPFFLCILFRWLTRMHDVQYLHLLDNLQNNSNNEKVYSSNFIQTCRLRHVLNSLLNSQQWDNAVILEVFDCSSQIPTRQHCKTLFIHLLFKHFIIRYRIG